MESVVIENETGRLVNVPPSFLDEYQSKFQKGEWKIINPKPHIEAEAGGASNKPFEVSSPAEPLKRSIVHFAPWPLHISGANRFMIDLARHQAKTCDVHLVVARGKSAWNTDGLSVHEFKEGDDVQKAIDRLSPSVLHIHHFSDKWRDLKNKSGGIVGTVHNYSGNLSRCAPQVPIFGEGGIYHGVDLGLYRPLESRKLRKPYKVGIIGRKEKLSVRFRNCIANGAFPDCAFQFIDNAPPDSMPTVYRGLDYLCQPFDMDATPYTVIEALASGVPVIARKVGAVPEILGDAGYLCEDENALYSFLSTIVNHDGEYSQLCIQSRERAEKLFNIERMCADYDAVYGDGIIPQRMIPSKPESVVVRRDETIGENPSVLCVIDRPGWAFDNIAKQIAKAHPDYKMHIVTYPEVGRAMQADILVSFWWESFGRIQKLNCYKKAITLVFDNYFWKLDLPKFQGIADASDLIGVANEKIKAAILEKLPHLSPKLFLCEDGVDTALFAPQPLPSEFTVGFNGRIRDSEHGLKGLDIIEEACRIAQVPLLSFDANAKQIKQAEMPEAFYRRISCYVCASTCEGTPNTVLEALACGRPVVSTDVGIVPKVVTGGQNGFIVKRDAREIADAILKIKEFGADKYAESARKAVESWDWKIKVGQYGTALRRVAGKKDVVDYSKDLTVFLVTFNDGSENYKHCKAALSMQDCKFRVEEIKNVAPMSAAFQQMLDRCQTPWFIQVDHDMILEPDAISKLWEYGHGMGEKDVIGCLPLWDVHMRREILGVKIYRHDIIKNYPYTNDYSCEVDQLRRMKADGYLVSMLWTGFERKHAIGEHGKYYTPRLAYERYRRFTEKRIKGYPVGWSHMLPREFLDRYKAEGNDVDLWAFIGCIGGLHSDIAKEEGELDLSRRNREFDRARFDLLERGPRELIGYVTSKCNAACKFCPRQKGMSISASDLTPEQVGKALKDYPTINSVCLAGFGEPLLSPNLFPIMRLCRERRKSFGVITNGLLLSKYKQELLEIKPDLTTISLNAFNESDHAERMGLKTPCFEEVLTTAAELGKLINVRLSFVLDSQNYIEADAMAALAGDNGLKVFFVNTLPDGQCGAWIDDAALTEEKHGAWLRELREKWTDGTVEAFPVLLTDNNPMLCRSPWQIISIDGAGRIGCCRRVYSPHASRWWDDDAITAYRIGLDGGEMKPACNKCFGNWKAE